MIKLKAFLFLTFVLSVSGSVTRSESSGDFYRVDYFMNGELNIKPVKIDARADIPELFEQKFRITEKTDTDSTFQEINGFRVQIFKTEDISEAKKREAMYIDNFGEDNVLLIFEKPFYKIRVGRLRNKDEAVELQDVLRKMGINGTIIVPDAVKVLMPAVKQKN